MRAKAIKKFSALLLALVVLLLVGAATTANAQATEDPFANSEELISDQQETILQEAAEDKTGAPESNQLEQKSGPVLLNGTAPFTLSIKDSKGNPLAGVSFSISGGQFGGSINNVGKSDGNGTLSLDLKPGKYNVTANYQQTKSSQTGVELTAGGLTLEFATHEACVKVQDSNGVPLANIGLNYHASSSYPTFGKTDASGISTRELFAGTYGIQAVYKGTRSGYIPVDITQPGIDHTFQTTSVQFNYPGRIDYLGADNSYHKLADANQAGQMFPGTYKFFFGGSVNPQFVQEITIGEENVNYSMALVTLKDSNGQGLAGGVVSYYAGGWTQNAAVTDANGAAVLLLPEGKSATSVAINYKGGRVQLNQSMSQNPVYNFTTVPVTVKLLNSKGEELTGSAKHYGTATDGWLNFGDNGEGVINATMEMLEQDYTFQANYKGALQNKRMTVSGPTEVIFQTKEVTLKLVDSRGNPLEGTAGFYAGKWQAFGDNGKANSTMELLPLEYSFEATYKGKRYQKKVNLADTSEVVFQVDVTLSGNLAVSKTVSGEGADVTKDFSFTVSLDDTSINGEYGDMTFENGVATFTLKHGESKTASGLPIGIAYSVLESDNDGYTVTVNNGNETEATGAIIEDETAVAAFNNDRPVGPAPDPVAVGLSATKTMDGTTPDEGAFAFYLKDVIISAI